MFACISITKYIPRFRNRDQPRISRRCRADPFPHRCFIRRHRLKRDRRVEAKRGINCRDLLCITGTSKAESKGVRGVQGRHPHSGQQITSHHTARRATNHNDQSPITFHPSRPILLLPVFPPRLHRQPPHRVGHSYSGFLQCRPFSK